MYSESNILYYILSEKDLFLYIDIKYESPF